MQLEKKDLKEYKKLRPLRKFSQVGLYNVTYLSNLAQRKKLKAKKVGRNYFTSQKWFDEYLELHARNDKIQKVIKEKNQKILDKESVILKPKSAIISSAPIVSTVNKMPDKRLEVETKNVVTTLGQKKLIKKVKSELTTSFSLENVLDKSIKGRPKIRLEKEKVHTWGRLYQEKNRKFKKQIKKEFRTALSVFVMSGFLLSKKYLNK